MNKMKSEWCEKGRACVEKCAWLGPLLARLILGVVFVTAGWGKLHHLDQVTSFFTQIGIPAASIQAPFVAGVEFVGGLMILAGFLTRLISIPLAFTMFIAIVTAKRGDIHSFTDLMGLDELAYLVMFVWLTCAGAGKISIDEWCHKRCEGKQKK